MYCYDIFDVAKNAALVLRFDCPAPIWSNLSTDLNLGSLFVIQTPMHKYINLMNHPAMSVSIIYQRLINMIIHKFYNSAMCHA
jgi:hypothetical protein